MALLSRHVQNYRRNFRLFRKIAFRNHYQLRMELKKLYGNGGVRILSTRAVWKALRLLTLERVGSVLLGHYREGV